MPKGVYEHKGHQGFQKGHSVWAGRKLTEQHKEKLRKPKGKRSHFKGRTYKEIYGYNWKEEIENRRLSKIAHHDKKGRSALFQRPAHWGWAYRKFAKAVFERDDFTCVLCGDRGGRLNADHYPESFRSICERLNIQTMEEAKGCEELWDIGNGRTLCEECHRKTGSYGGHSCSEETREKIGDAVRNRERTERKALCHPDRKHFCRGLCRTCYQREYRKKKSNEETV